jgi:molybdopterin converting factor small subunit
LAVQVTVSFLGALRDKVGARSLVVELPATATYRDLLDGIAPTMRAKLPAWAWDGEKRSFPKQMMVSRNLSVDLRDEATPLADGDEIIVVPPLAGG